MSVVEQILAASQERTSKRTAEAARFAPIPDIANQLRKLPGKVCARRSLVKDAYFIGVVALSSG